MWRTNCRPPAVDAPGRLPWLIQTLRPLRYSKRINFESTISLPTRPTRPPMAPKHKPKVNVKKQNRGKKPPGTTTQLEIPERKERERLRSAKTRAEKKEKRQCSSCLAPAVPVRTQCQACAVKNRARMNASNTKKRADKKALTKDPALP